MPKPRPVRGNRQDGEARQSCYFPPSAITGVRQDELTDLPPGPRGTRSPSPVEEDGGTRAVSLLTELFKGMLATGDPTFLSLWGKGGATAGRTQRKTSKAPSREVCGWVLWQ